MSDSLEQIDNKEIEFEKKPFIKAIKLISSILIGISALIGAFKSELIPFYNSVVHSNEERFATKVTFNFIDMKTDVILPNIKIISPTNIECLENHQFLFRSNQINSQQELIIKLPSGKEKVCFLTINSDSLQTQTISIDND